MLTDIITSNTKRMNNINPYDDCDEIEGGPNTKEYVFCLSTDEVKQYFGISNHLPPPNPMIPHGAVSKINNNIISAGSPYAYSHELYYGPNRNAPYWWLRSPGGAAGMAALIINGNILYTPGEHVEDETIGVRPAIWVDKKYILEKKIIAQRIRYNLCRYCGGKFKGFFTKKCSVCGKEKDY